MFTWALDAIKQLMQLVAWLLIRPGFVEDQSENKHREEKYKRFVEFLYAYLFLYHRHQFAALLIMILHLFTSLVLILLEKVGGIPQLVHVEWEVAWQLSEATHRWGLPHEGEWEQQRCSA